MASYFSRPTGENGLSVSVISAPPGFNTAIVGLGGFSSTASAGAIEVTYRAARYTVNGTRYIATAVEMQVACNSPMSDWESYVSASRNSVPAINPNTATATARLRVTAVVVVVEEPAELPEDAESWDDVPLWHVTTASSPVAGGTTSGDGYYYEGTSCTISATPASGYEFVCWTGGISASTSTYTFTVDSDVSCTANFQVVEDTYIVTTAANPVAGGTTTGDGQYASGSTCTVTAQPAQGYEFVRWELSTGDPSRSRNYSFTVTQDTTATAYFRQYTNLLLHGSSNTLLHGSSGTLLHDA